MNIQQTSKGDSEAIRFRRQTNTYSLQVQLTDTKLALKLKDYIDWAIYGKQYSEEDIGKEIHRKVDLVDVYASFAMTKMYNYVEGRLSKYQFGTVVLGEEEMQCYKIEQKGKVTVYRNVFQKKNKEEKMLTFTSSLTLNKERDMNQMEIFITKSEMQKRELSEHFTQEIGKVNQQTKTLQEKTVHLGTGLEKCEKKGQQLTEDVKKLTASTQKNETKQHELSQEIKKLVTRLENAEKKSNQLNQQIKKLTTNLDKERQQRKQEIKKINDDITAMKKQQEALKNANPFALSFPRVYGIIESPYSKNFRVMGSAVEYTSNGWNQLMLNDRIPFAVNYIFKVKLVRSASRYVMIGIVDIAKQKAASTSHSSSNAIAYYCANGYRYPNMAVEGAGVSVGETAQVCVNLQAKSVKVTVAGSLRATLVHDILVDQNRQFVPYVEMNTNTDLIEWTF